ncbi:MAG: nucleotidyltransferase domain-containing protein [Nanoarchaeota archaeon]
MFDKLGGKTLEVLNLFLDNPNTEFYLREIARKLKISTSTAKIALDILLEEKLVKEEKKANLRLFRADLDSNVFRKFKVIKNLKFIEKSNLVKKLLNDKIISIILYGSYAKGINVKESDIDILLIVREKISFNLSNINNTELQLIQKTNKEFRELKQKDNPFYIEIITSGIPLYGELPI